jgi:hypothetical protein
MTPEQRKMARHALGLDSSKRSYRNRYYAGVDAAIEVWRDLKRKGMALTAVEPPAGVLHADAQGRRGGASLANRLPGKFS